MSAETLRASNLEKWTAWMVRYKSRVATEVEWKSEEERRRAMNLVNPKFVLRNHVAQRAIDEAEKGNYKEAATVLNLMMSPFDEHDELNDIDAYTTSMLRDICVSCSS